MATPNGGIRVTLVGVDPTAATLQVQLESDGPPVDETFPIGPLPMVTILDELAPGPWLARLTAWDPRPAALQTLAVPRVPVAAGGLTDLTVDLARGLVTPSEECNGLDDDGDGVVDEPLDLPPCLACVGGQPAGLEDDERCGVIECGALDTFELRGENSAAGVATCVRLAHAPLTAGRCVGAGVCAAPHGPACGEADEVLLARADLCQVLSGCAEGRPSVTWVPDGTPCGEGRSCHAGACAAPSPVDAGVVARDPSGCADGARDGFLSIASYPEIAACSGGWTVPGVTASTAPACGRVSGDDSANAEGTGCSAADLCAAGWHLCRGKDEVGLKGQGSCADAVPPGARPNSLFFAVVQASQLNSACDVAGDNDVFGCGNLGVQLAAGKNCGVLTRALASTQPGTCGFNEAEPSLGPWQCLGGVGADLHEGALVTKHGCAGRSCSFDGAPVGNSDKGGVLCCRD